MPRKTVQNHSRKSRLSGIDLTKMAQAKHTIPVKIIYFHDPVAPSFKIGWHLCSDFDTIFIGINWVDAGNHIRTLADTTTLPKKQPPKPKHRWAFSNIKIFQSVSIGALLAKALFT